LRIKEQETYLTLQEHDDDDDDDYDMRSINSSVNNMINVPFNLKE